MLRLAFDFIITWRETRTRPNAYFISSMKTTKCGFHIQTNVLLYSFPSTVIVFANILPSGVFICLELASRGRSMSTVTSSTSSFSVCSFRT